MAKCNACEGSGEVVLYSADGEPVDGASCSICNGTGQQPEAPAPAAPAELAAKLLDKADDLAKGGTVLPGHVATMKEAAAMLTRQAEQLQRQAAVVEAARAWRDSRAVVVDRFASFRTAGRVTAVANYKAAERKLEAALAALEATDGR